MARYPFARRSVSIAVAAVGSLWAHASGAAVEPEVEYAATNFFPVVITPWFETPAEACEYCSVLAPRRDYYYDPAKCPGFCGFVALDPPYGVAECYQPLTTRQVCRNAKLVNGMCTCNPGFVEQDGQCVPCPDNAVIVGGSCQCDAAKGYVSQGGACVCGPNSYDAGGVCICSPDSVLQGDDCVKCPDNAVVVNGDCQCDVDKGYVDQGGACVCGPHSFDAGGVCICNPDAVLQGNDCVPCPANASKVDNACVCNQGYALDPLTGECKLECTAQMCTETCGAGSVTPSTMHRHLSSAYPLEAPPELLGVGPGAFVTVEAVDGTPAAASCASGCAATSVGHADVVASALGMVASGVVPMTSTTTFATKCEEETCSTVCDEGTSCRESSWSGALGGGGTIGGSVTGGASLGTGLAIGITCSFASNLKIVGEVVGRQVTAAGPAASCVDCDEQKVNLGADKSAETSTSSCTAALSVGPRRDDGIDQQQWLERRLLTVANGPRTTQREDGRLTQILTTCTDCGTTAHDVFLQTSERSGSCGADKCVTGQVAQELKVRFAPNCADLHGRGTGYALDVTFKRNCFVLDCTGLARCVDFDPVLTTVAVSCL